MMTKARVRAWLEQRFFLRIHMTLILGGTFLAGVVTTRMLMLGGVNVLAVRYAIAICLAYLVFLVLVRLWLMYVGSGGSSRVDIGDMVDMVDIPLSDAQHIAPVHASGGGGGGSWDLDFGGDLEDVVFVIVLIAIVVLLGGLAIYFIYTAPVLLSEAAFEAALAASLARRTRKATGPGWVGTVWRATVWPFVIVLALSVLLGWLAQRRCPEALRLRDAISCATPR